MNFPDPLGLDKGSSRVGLTPLFLISGRKQLIGIRGAGIDIERRVQFLNGNVRAIQLQMSARGLHRSKYAKRIQLQSASIVGKSVLPLTDRGVIVTAVQIRA